jgi:DnaJ family protein C protein 2
MLALPHGDNKENEIFSGYTACDELRRKVEPVGKFFEEYIQKKLMKYESFFDEFINPNSNQDVFIEEDEEEYEWEKEYRESSKNLKEAITFSNKENYYAMLGIEDLFLNATTDDIRRAYKKMVLIYHPDKNKENVSLESENDSGVDTNLNNINNQENEEGGIKINMTEEEKKKMEINQKWLKIKEAYETLLDPEKKKKYDSTFEFDDTIPDEDESYDEKDYFRTFGPVFIKNSIWSKRKPIPKIGDMKTPLDRVKRFYQFWYNFDTWRDFSVEGEHNVEEASCRYEKRQMLKENKKMKSSLMKEEKVRLNKLVTMAYKNDPRITREEEKIRKEREKMKQERLIQKQKEKEEEEERVRQMKFQYEDNLRKQKEMQAKERETYIQTLISLADTLQINLGKEDLFHINLNGKVDTIKKILAEIEKKEITSDKVRIFKNMTSSLLGLKFADFEESKENSIWTKEEIFALQRSVKKYPVGTKNRAEKIGEIIKSKSSGQIIQMIHFLTTNPSIKFENDFDLNQFLNNSNKSKKEAEVSKEKETKESMNTNTTAKPTTQTTQANAEDNWSEEQQKALEAALRKYPSTIPVNERWTNISKDVPGKTKKQCVDRYKYLSSIVNKK